MRSRMALVLALFLFLLVRDSVACLWTYATNLEGQVEWINSLSASEFAKGFARKLSRESLLASAALLKQKAEQEKENHELRNDYAVMLVRAGELTEALTVLNEIEAAKPGLYPTAANLGTVYELSGDVEKSRHWIEEGLARNPQSHNGSEWLHVRILKAKQQLAADPNWLKTHSILGLNFGDASEPARPTDEALAALGAPQTWEQLAEHLKYQLQERTSLVDPPDAIVADLLADLGNVFALNGKLEFAIVVTELAQRYESPQDELLERRLSHFRKIVNAAVKPSRDPSGDLARGIIRLMLGTTLALAVFVIWRRRRQKAASAKLP